MEYVFHSVAYVMNEWHCEEDDIYKYIPAKVSIEYYGWPFEEYEVIYGLDGGYEYAYLRMV